ncbi:tetratricopeptide repeat protein [Catellatospora coxensis]|uniref:Tetratricopeptide repeat protein n=1 Tax=Catellatospora coxensis TaxID=310354 RepID=A0A8J3L438_9ACTN|nr:tetratricopeptide repeat protein [Catellatospora coxensis]GIG11413.1 hypothetical protein Cco03nite_81130 [Catellatospora coxensis]
MDESTYVPYGMVRLLVERDCLDTLRAEADRGDWRCGAALIDELVRRGEAEAALAVCRTFVRPDRWNGAADKTAAVLEASYGLEEAVAFVRPYAAAGERSAVHRLAALLGRLGQVDEVFALLRPRLDDWWMASNLVEATEGQGRDEDVIAELETLVAAVERHPDRWQAKPWNAAESLATVLDRQGRSDEAIALLRRVRRTSVNQIEHLADLLHKAGRESELRDLVAGEGREHAAYRLANLLEEQNRLAEAVDTLRAFTDAGNINAASALAELLRRHGRGEEAVEVLHTAVRAEGAAHGCTRHHLWTLLVEAERPEDALGHLDELEREFGPEELFRDRLWLLAECGRSEEALARVRAHPQAGEDGFLQLAAQTLDDLGRTDEAIALLRPRATSHFVGNDLAEMLLRRGEVDEAMAVVHALEPLKLWPDSGAGVSPD